MTLISNNNCLKCFLLNLYKSKQMRLYALQVRFISIPFFMQSKCIFYLVVKQESIQKYYLFSYTILSEKQANFSHIQKIIKTYQHMVSIQMFFIHFGTLSSTNQEKIDLKNDKQMLKFHQYQFLLYLHYNFDIYHLSYRAMEIILMGASKAGRTSIAKVIFHKLVPKQTQQLAETTKIETFDFKIQKIDFKIYDFPAKYDIKNPAPNEQLIFENASALIYVLNPQIDTIKSSDDFLVIYEYMKKKNKNNCYFAIFINKADIDLTHQQAKRDYQFKLKKKLFPDNSDSSKEGHKVDFYFTSIFDSTVHEAFSKVMMNTIPCAPYLNKLLNTFAVTSNVQKVYLFDVVSKIYIANNQQVSVDTKKFQACFDVIDVFLDMSFLYGNSNQDDSENKATIRLEADENNQVIILKYVEKLLALVFIIKQSNYDHPFLIDKNIEVFKSALTEYLNATIAAIK